ncbi:glycosyltransferase family 2 protein [Patescibacteria group bacterium]|nr:glycosyltransferase family 2 protein [Patescibacteria group bacterium]
MPKLSINLLRYTTPWEEIKECIDSVLAQDYEDFELVYSENAPAGKPRLIERVRKHYAGNPKLRAVDNGDNLGYAGGHNKFFMDTPSELLMPLNPDVIMQTGFLEEIIKVFSDPKVGAATGKMIKPKPNEQGKQVLDGTGLIIFKSRRARERGQLEVDSGQYDNSPDIFGVSGTAAVYRKQALESVKLYEREYFDPDFFAYWEDLDLSWRLRLHGWYAKYVPTARIFHTRVVGVSPGGYKKFFTFVKHHKGFSKNIRRWNWRNHLFAIIKNDFGWNFWKNSWRIIGREIAMLGYIAIFETSTLGALPVFFRLLPKMLAKRKIIQKNKTATSKEMEKWFI